MQDVQWEKKILQAMLDDLTYTCAAQLENLRLESCLKESVAIWIILAIGWLWTHQETVLSWNNTSVIIAAQTRDQHYPAMQAKISFINMNLWVCLWFS